MCSQLTTEIKLLTRVIFLFFLISQNFFPFLFQLSFSQPLSFLILFLTLWCDIQKDRGQREYWPLKRNEWPNALLLSRSYCDLTSVCVVFIFTKEKVEVLWCLWHMSLQILIWIQSWYLSFSIVVTQSFIATWRGSLGKEPCCISLLLMWRLGQSALKDCQPEEIWVWPKLWMRQDVE